MVQDVADKFLVCFILFVHQHVEQAIIKENVAAFVNVVK